MKHAKSLRQWALLVTGLGAVVAFPRVVLWVVADVYNLGVPILPGLILWGACALMMGGVLTLILDGVLRLTGQRFYGNSSATSQSLQPIRASAVPLEEGHPLTLSADARRFMRIPLLVIVLGAVVAAGAWIWNIASCCEGGANIGAGMLFILGLAMLAGGFLWAVLVVIVGLRRGK